MNIFNNAIPSIFGNGLVGNAVTGLVRIPAFISNAVAVMMVAELAIRALSSALHAVGLNPSNDSWIHQAADTISEGGVRPYRPYKKILDAHGNPVLDQNNQPRYEKTHWTLGTLITRTVAYAALGIIGSEAVRILGGTAPGVYNNVLTLLGPIRIDTRPYLDCVRVLLASSGVI
jgi:hypothetical protein